jgi:hypothetical protein
LADQDHTAYAVKRPLASHAAVRTDEVIFESVDPKPRRSAVFVAHGMGQQIPFQTLDQIALGLRRQDPRWDEKKPENVRGAARTVESQPGQPFQRLELQLEDAQGGSHEVHVYEAYWAPLTEGNVTLRDTMRFLLDGGLNGLHQGTFKRWLFGTYRPFPIPVRTVFYLLVAMAVVAALIVLNTTIGLVAAGRSVLASPPHWLSNGLFADLTTMFNLVVIWMVAFGLCLVISKGLRGLKVPLVAQHAWGAVATLFFISALFVTIGAGGAVPVLLYGHLKDQGTPGREIWKVLFDPRAVETFNDRFDWWTLRLLAFILIAAVAWTAFRLLRSAVREMREDRTGRLWTLVVTVAFAAIVFGLIVEGRTFWSYFQSASNQERSDGGLMATALKGLAWPILIFASAFIRKFLVQYLGDVAVYVTSNKLDRFYKLRQEIKAVALNALRAVYQQKDESHYDQVIVVGHSLGSVIVYDALNAMVNEDMLNGDALGVVDRTPMLVTFASPLDKLAFLFALQKNKTDEAREALAASLQPLVESYEFRPKRWINIYSPWDIIGGRILFYDPPDGPADPKAVVNRIDPKATTLLAAHTEFWDDPLLYETIFQQVTA